MPRQQKQEVNRLIFDTYIAVVQNSVGSKLFRNFYAKVDGKKKDVTRNGELSCAFHTSSILSLFKLVKGIHGTVNSTVKDLQKSGWKSVKKPKIGSIIVWEPIGFKNTGIHKHIGFFIGNNMAISNSDKKGYPVRHHLTFGTKKTRRKIETVLWNDKLKN